ncbi:MAG TPA: flavodoxin [Rhodocyclaceae bacterium]|nr:flavodoxin [Rhodocyclaceae bacterium]
MASIGIFFGTDTGRTRKIAKLIARKLGEVAAAPINVAKAQPEDLLAYPALILGTPTYGEGALPGLGTGCQTESWDEFLPKLKGLDFTGKTIALYGLGEQERYPDVFVDAMAALYDHLLAHGAHLVGDWSAEGYHFNASLAEEDGRFVGLALDLVTQDHLTESRIDTWLAQILPQLLSAAETAG